MYILNPSFTDNAIKTAYRKPRTRTSDHGYQYCEYCRKTFDRK